MSRRTSSIVPSSPSPVGTSVGKEDESHKKKKISSACVTCRRTKRKCDGKKTCSQCVNSKMSQSCEYNPDSDGRRMQGKKRAAQVSELENLRTVFTHLTTTDDRSASSVFDRIRQKQTLEELVDYITDSEVIDSGGRGPTIDKEIVSKLSGVQVSSKGAMQSSVEDADTRLWTSPSTLSGDQRSIGRDFFPWTAATSNHNLVQHLVEIYICWLHHVVPVLCRPRFLQAFTTGERQYCSPLLVNAICATASLYCMTNDLPSEGVDYEELAKRFMAQAEALAHEEMSNRNFSITMVQALAIMSFYHLQKGGGVPMWNRLSDASISMQNLALDIVSNGDPRSDLARVTFWGLLIMDRLTTLVSGRPGQLRTSSRPPMPTHRPVNSQDIWYPVYTDSTQMSSITPRRECTVQVASAQCELYKIFDSVHTSFYLQGQPLKVSDINSIHRRLRDLWDIMPPLDEPTAAPSIFHLRSIYHAITLTLFRPFIKTTNKSFSVNPREVCLEAALSIIELHEQHQSNFDSRHWNICHMHHLFAAAWTFVSDFSSPNSFTLFVNCLAMIQTMELKFMGPVSNAFSFLFSFLKRWNKWTPQIWHACMSVVPPNAANGALCRALSACSPGTPPMQDQFEAAAVEFSFGDWLGGGVATGAAYVPYLYLDEVDFMDPI